MLKKIIEYIPIISVFLLFFGFCNQYGYYSAFGIEITDYISTTDLLMSFLPNIFWGIVFLLGYFLFAFLGPKNEVQEITSIKHNLFFKFLLVVLIIIQATVEIFFLVDGKPHPDLILYSSIALIILEYTLISTHYSIEVLEKSSIFITFMAIAYIGVQLLLYGATEGLDLKRKHNSNYVTFKYNNLKVVKTSDSLIYVGQTSNTMFLYNRKDSSTLIFKMSNIDSLIIKEIK